MNNTDLKSETTARFTASGKGFIFHMKEDYLIFRNRTFTHWKGDIGVMARIMSVNRNTPIKVKGHVMGHTCIILN